MLINHIFGFLAHLFSLEFLEKFIMLFLKLEIALPFLNKIKAESAKLFSKSIEQLSLIFILYGKCKYSHCVKLIWVDQWNHNHLFFVLILDRKLKR